MALAILTGCEEGPAPQVERTGPVAPSPDAGVFEPEPVRCEIDAPFIPGQTLPRRLTAYELRNTVYDLVGIEVPFTVNFPQEETSLGFDNNARALQVTPLHAERFMEAAEYIAAQMVGRIDEFLPCVDGALSDECVDEFIEDFASRAWRRPVGEAELERLWSLYELGAGDDGEDLKRGHCHSGRGRTAVSALPISHRGWRACGRQRRCASSHPLSWHRG